MSTTRSTKDAWLSGPSDLAEDIVEDVPVKGQNIKVRGLPAQFSNEAQSKALKMITGSRGEQTATVDVAAMSVIQFQHGCVEPQFTHAEAKQISERFGPAFFKVVNKIDELSGVDKEAIDQANDQFRSGVEEPGDGGASESDAVASVDSGSAVSGGAGA